MKNNGHFTMLLTVCKNEGENNFVSKGIPIKDEAIRIKNQTLLESIFK
jgi:hypothetical protein